jgi:hypothetical protein
MAQRIREGDGHAFFRVPKNSGLDHWVQVISRAIFGKLENVFALAEAP